MSSSHSLIPGIAREAASSKVTVSVLLIAALCYGAHQVGRSGAEDQITRAKRDAEIASSLAVISTVVERLEIEAKDLRRDVRVVDEKVNRVSNELATKEK